MPIVADRNIRAVVTRAGRPEKMQILPKRELSQTNNVARAYNGRTGTAGYGPVRCEHGDPTLPHGLVSARENLGPVGDAQKNAK